MNRIDVTITHAKAAKRRLISPYITAGDPNLELTLELMHALTDAGADILEIGLPFSDPMAEGEVIQAAMERACAQNITCKDVLKLIAKFRQSDQSTPVVLMGYTNIIECYGYQSFASDAKKAGVDGTILVDCPPEESHELCEIWQQHQLYPIFLCSPTTTPARIKALKQYARGYVYFVSLKGVTGANHLDVATIKQTYIDRQAQISLPLLVGFGIKNADMAAQIAEFADGVIIGAALIQTIEKAHKAQQNAVRSGAQFITEIRQAMDNIGAS